MHIEFEAQASLFRDVRCFWALEEDQAVYNRSEILPDSTVELVVNCGGPLAWVRDDGARVELPRVFMKGLTGKALRLEVVGREPCQIVGVRLYAWAAAWWGIEPQESGLPFMGLDGRWDDVAGLVGKMVERRGYEAGVDVMRGFMEEIGRRRNVPSEQEPVQRAGELMYLTDGQIRVEELIQRSYLSPRQFERRFKGYTGVTPKQFGRLVRFEAVRDTLLDDPQQSMVDVATRFGYTDQSHFIKDFKAFAGRTPGELREMGMLGNGSW